MGLGMVRVTTEEMAFRVFRTLETIRGVYYVQRAIDHDGCDVRVFVVGGRVVSAIERSAAGWKTNLARGGRARATTLSDTREALALRAARAVGADYAGVDLLAARRPTPTSAWCCCSPRSPEPPYAFPPRADRFGAPSPPRSPRAPWPTRGRRTPRSAAPGPAASAARGSRMSPARRP